MMSANSAGGDESQHGEVLIGRTGVRVIRRGGV